MTIGCNALATKERSFKCVAPAVTETSVVNDRETHYIEGESATDAVQAFYMTHPYPPKMN
jgi:hypothetical protein